MTHEQHQHHHLCWWCNNHCTCIVHQIARTNLYHHPIANGCGQPHLKSIGHGLAASWNGKLATSLGSFKGTFCFYFESSMTSSPCACCNCGKAFFCSLHHPNSTDASMRSCKLKFQWWVIRTGIWRIFFGILPMVVHGPFQRQFQK